MNKYNIERTRFNELYNQILNKDKNYNDIIHVGLILKNIIDQKKYNNNIAVICENKNITYKELFNKSLILAKKLKEFNISKNDNIILLIENSIEFYITYFAIWNLAAINVPLNINLSTKEINHIIKDSDAKVIITSKNLENKIQKEYNKDILIINDVNELIELKNDKNTQDFKYEDKNPDDIAVILYTSGTTGTSKGVMLSSRNILINAIQGISRFQIQRENKIYSPLPLFHSLPQNVCIWATTLVGATAIISSKIDRSSILKGISYNPHMVVAVPAIYGLFCLMKTIDFKNVRYFVSGGDALSDKTRKFFKLLYNRSISNGYGLTEASPFVSIDIDDYIKPTNNVGDPFINIEVKIKDQNSNIELNKNEIGILYIKGDNIMKGYYKAEEATNDILNDGWLNTKDLAYIDNDGKIVIVGREKDMIINKGVKIYPQEIENILLSSPYVNQAAVIGYKNNEEEIPIAFVAIKNVTDVNKIKDELKILCQTHLASYKIPREIIIKKELIINTTGKIDKKILLAEFLENIAKNKNE